MRNKINYIKDVINLINDPQVKLERDDILNMLDLAENNEYGLAFELLCTQLYEYQISISRKYYHKLVKYGNNIGLSCKELDYLSELIV